MGTIDKEHTFLPENPAKASEVNENFNTIYTEFNGYINHENIQTEGITKEEIDSEAMFNANEYKGNDIDTDGDGKVNEAEVADLALETNNTTYWNNYQISETITGNLEVFSSEDIEQIDLGIGGGVHQQFLISVYSDKGEVGRGIVDIGGESSPVSASAWISSPPTTGGNYKLNIYTGLFSPPSDGRTFYYNVLVIGA